MEIGKVRPNRGFRFKQLQPLPGLPKLLEAWLSPDSDNDSGNVDRFNPKMLFSWTSCDKILRPGFMTTNTLMDWPLFQLTNLEWLGELYATPVFLACVLGVVITCSVSQASCCIWYCDAIRTGVQVNSRILRWFQCFRVLSYLSQASSPRLPWPQSQKVRHMNRAAANVILQHSGVSRN